MECRPKSRPPTDEPGAPGDDHAATMNATTPLPLHNRVHDIVSQHDRHAAASATRLSTPAASAPQPMPIPPSRRPLAFDLDAYYASERAELPL